MRSFTFDDVIYRADWPQQSSIIRLSPQILQWSINDRYFMRITGGRCFDTFYRSKHILYSERMVKRVVFSS